MTDRDRTIWVLSDGKAGDENQCLGVAERLGGTIDVRLVAPGRPWVWAMPWGPIPPQDRPDKEGSPLSPPFPDVAIASGRRTVAYLRKLKEISPETTTVFLKDPRTKSLNADLIWVPIHDKHRGSNVLATLTAPHRLSPARLNEARTGGPSELHRLAAPRVALVLGGDTAKSAFGTRAAHRLADHLVRHLPANMSIMVTPSRRTPAHLMKAVKQALLPRPHWIWDGSGTNPYATMLALADAIIVTADSHSMLSDVMATNAPIYIFEPDGYPPKLKGTIDQLVTHPYVQRLEDTLETGSRAPIDSTELIADEIRDLLKTT
ncbi:mitochondrial fission ELM1 family protein [Cohaesibacter sp. ES.047]|uniref:mitochondrial fission ELM1 family protein n=1 Tax=Cohaesibacter sp. ES.047 TaxID=1798205 RepID=UPI001FCF1CDF|nr:mitochondrial fission ELM1 family protein [Cohaesibacter sp. ES.047]